MFLSLHLTFLVSTAVVILYSDHKGLLYMLGKHEVLSERFVTLSHRLVWIGLLGMIATGAALAAPMLEYVLTERVFYIKMGFVFVLIMNAFAIGMFAKDATHTPFADLSKNRKLFLLLSGALSATGWIGAATMGYFFL